MKLYRALALTSQQSRKLVFAVRVLCTVLAISLTQMDRVLGQSNDELARAIMLHVTEADKRDFPQPDVTMQHMLLKKPEYATTRERCRRERAIGDFLTGKLSDVGRKNVHAETPRYVSVTLSGAGEHFHSVNLDSAEREKLRYLLYERITDIDSSKAVSDFMFAVISAPGVVRSSISTWALYFADVAATYELDQSSARDRYVILRDQLRSETVLYRTIQVAKDVAGREIVRYQYAVWPKDRDLVILMTCSYARHP